MRRKIALKGHQFKETDDLNECDKFIEGQSKNWLPELIQDVEALRDV